MFYTEPYHLQKGAGVFEVDRYPLQRGRGLGGIFANLLRKIIPYGKTFAKAAASTGKKVLQSDIGKDILNDTIRSAAAAATTALLENNPKDQNLNHSKYDLKLLIKHFQLQKNILKFGGANLDDDLF